MNTIIRYEHVGKQYDAHTALKDITLSIEHGEFITIIGSSGCGKTTLLKILNGLVSPTSGDVFVHGQNVKEKNIIEHRRNIGYAIQGNVLFPHMTVAQNITYVPNLKGKRSKKEDEALVAHWLQMLGLEANCKDRYPDELSGGQQQRIGIARALSASPQILLMDEPFGAVDEITRTQLQQELKEIHAKTAVTILFVTHNISEALLLGTKVLIMDKGSVQQFDTPHAIMHTPQTDFVQQLLSNRC